MGKQGAKARMRMLEAGSNQNRGFTLLELLIVVSLIAIATGAATLALRDSNATALEREADRVLAVVEAARTQSRASGLQLVWLPSADGFRVLGEGQRVDTSRDANAAAGGLTPWLAAGTTAANEDTDSRNALASSQRPSSLILGPEPIIPAQSITLRLGQRSITLATDGLRPFAVAALPAEATK
jgi:general secretion pathway protein H